VRDGEFMKKSSKETWRFDAFFFDLQTSREQPAFSGMSCATTTCARIASMVRSFKGSLANI